MEINLALPVFVTFTGADRTDLVPGMQALSARYPIEWGVLIDPLREGIPRFPAPFVRRAMQCAGLRLSAHVCGIAARAIAEGHDTRLDFGGFSRVQINHGNAGSTESEIRNCHLFGMRHGVRPILQCQGSFPADDRMDWLYDVSFGKGVRPSTWPALVRQPPFCGYSGGLGPATVRDTLAGIRIVPGASYWIDIESGVTTENSFDLSKCEAICRALFESS